MSFYYVSYKINALHSEPDFGFVANSDSFQFDNDSKAIEWFENKVKLALGHWNVKGKMDVNLMTQNGIKRIWTFEN